MRRSLLIAAALCSAVNTASAQGTPAAMDSLLQKLVGHWRMTGTVRGHLATYQLEATRTLGSRFVELHMEDIARPSQYEALVFIGVDSAGKRYIAHWLDSFGAGFSIPTASGFSVGDTIQLDFPYPTGAFKDRFVYHHDSDSWDLRLDKADPASGWKLFAEYDVRHP